MNLCDNEEPSTDAVLRALSHEHRRIIFGYLAKQPEKDVDCGDVVEYLSLHEPSDADFETLEIQCHHVHFPKLDESGVIKHDVDGNTIHIEHRMMMEKITNLIKELEK